MANTTRNTNPQQSGRRPPPAFVSNNAPEVVDPIWLLKAIGITIFAALICGYFTLCFLFYQGQWQLVLHPSKAAPAPSTIAGTAYETIHFGVDESGAPQLTGWWIPSDQGGRYSAYTFLYLPSGDGSLAVASQELASLHTLGINIFAFDYRGYGQSAATHPNQARMTEDATSAWRYLTMSRAIAPVRIIPFGVGVGGALAVQLAAKYSELPAVVAESPRPDLLQVVLADPRTKMLPVRALFHERFEITAPLAVLKTAKLLILTGGGTPGRSSSTESMVNPVADPKLVSILNPAELNSPVYLEQIRRFLDQYLPLSQY